MSGLRALVVDDDDNYRTFVCTLLRRAGIFADIAHDGEEALTSLSKGNPYDLMLIDYEMPRVNGLQLIQRLRAEDATSTTYAIMLTARVDVETKIAALTAGFDDFLLKSATELELLAKVVASKRLIVRQQTVDVTVRHLRGLAETDELTQLHNRRFFLDEAENALRGPRDLTVVLFDLDGFKQINDTYGHLAGDQVLRDVAAVLKRGTRYEDFVARLGGDEFVMLVHELSLPEIEQIISRITTQVGRLRWTSDSAMFEVGVTAGVSRTELLQTRDLRALLDASDRDLYKNKFLKKSPAQPAQQPSIYEYEQDADAEVVEFPGASAEEMPQQAQMRMDGRESDE